MIFRLDLQLDNSLFYYFNQPQTYHFKHFYPENFVVKLLSWDNSPKIILWNSKNAILVSFSHLIYPFNTNFSKDKNEKILPEKSQKIIFSTVVNICIFGSSHCQHSCIPIDHIFPAWIFSWCRILSGCWHRAHLSWPWRLPSDWILLLRLHGSPKLNPYPEYPSSPGLYYAGKDSVDSVVLTTTAYKSHIRTCLICCISS